METVDVHCPCGLQYEMVLFNSITLDSPPSRRTEEGGRPCPDCGLLYKRSWPLPIPERRVIGKADFQQQLEGAMSPRCSPD